MLFEAGMKVLLIMKWPGMIKPGVSSERVVGIDIYPTMLGAAGRTLHCIIGSQHLGCGFTTGGSRGPSKGKALRL